MEQAHDSAEPLEGNPVADWLRLLRAQNGMFELSDATKQLIADGTVPRWDADASDVIGDLVRNGLFDVLEAILDARPFDLGCLTVEGDWFAGGREGEPTPLLQLLLLVRAKLLGAGPSTVLHLVFHQVAWSPQESLYWIDSMPATTCQLFLGFKSCDFGDAHDRMLEGTLHAPLLCELTLELLSEQSLLSETFCSLLSKHQGLTCLRLPSMSSRLSRALAPGLDGNQGLVELVVCLKDEGAYDDILRALRGHPRLEKLQLECITSRDAQALEVLPSMPALKVLLVAGIGDDAVVPECAFEGLEQLTIKSLAPPRHAEAGHSILKALCNGRALRSLHWWHAHNLVQHKELVSAWMREAGKLKLLSLRHAPGESAQVVLDCMALNASIASLFLHSCEALTLPSISLSGLAKHPSLKSLTIEDSPFSESVCTQVAQLIEAPSVLEHLWVLSCPVESAGLVHFCAALETAPTLLTLDLNHSVDAAQFPSVFKAIRRNRSLKRLSFWPTVTSPEPITRESVEDCLSDQFALLALEDWLSGTFDAQAAVLLETLLERNRQAASPDKLARWRLAVQMFVEKTNVTAPLPADIAQPLWNSFVQTLPDEGGRQRQVPRSRAAYEALQTLEQIGRLPL